MISLAKEKPLERVERRRSSQTTAREDDNMGTYPKLDFDRLVLGKILGHGAFCTVSELRSINLPRHGGSARMGGKGSMNTSTGIITTPDDTVTNTESYSGGEYGYTFLATHCLRDMGEARRGDARYAVKVLTPSNISSAPNNYARGIMDLANETRILSSLVHPNIIKLWAIAQCSPSDGSSCFIVMDRLYDTLEQRMVKWRVKLARLTGVVGRFQDRKGTKCAAIYEERIVAAYDLATAIAYLHDCQIVHRDIKVSSLLHITFMNLTEHAYIYISHI
jgi:serine/threonine protein kinase